MKSILILCIFFLLTSCVQNFPPNVEVITTTRPTPVLSEFERAEKAKQAEKEKNELKKFIGEESKFYSLTNLDNENLSDKDIVMRLWRFSTFGDKHLVFVLTKINEVWAAKLIQRKISSKYIFSDMPRKNLLKYAKYSQVKLDVPKSGWQNLWQNLNKADILTLPNGNEVGIEVFPDSSECVIETKVDNNYRVINYYDSELFEDIPQAQKMVKIINIVSEEFNLSDFEQQNFLQP
jgi:hypothetical protein